MVKRLTDRVYCLSHDPSTDRPAIGIILGDRAVMLIDGGNSPAHAAEVKAAVSRLSSRPIKYIGLSHWHWDHSFGLSAYEDSIIIAHPECNNALLRMKDYKWDDEALDGRVRRGEEIDFCAENIKKEFKNREDIKIRTADILTRGGISIDLGGLQVKCLYIGGEHSADSLGYFVEGENVLFLGDSLCHNMFSGPWSYELEDFRRCLSRFEKLPAQWFVNSHWAPENKEAFRAFADNMILTGETAADSLSLQAACENYKKRRGREPDSEERELLKSFVEGNIKKLKNAERASK